MSTEYHRMQQELCQGWNTWNTRSMLSHVLLPSGFALNLGIKDYISGYHLDEALVGRHGENAEMVRPGAHAYDGSYTELTLTWRGIALHVQSAITDEGDLVLWITPQTIPRIPPALVVEGGFLWNRRGYVTHESASLVGHMPGQDIAVHATVPGISAPIVKAQTAYLALPLERPVGVSTRIRRDADEIQTIIAGKRAIYEKQAATYDELAPVYTALQSCLAWNTIYDPLRDRVISPVTRIWNLRRGGWVLFCWDTFFAAYLALLDSKELAYANVVEALHEKTAEGFVPNNSQGNLRKARDRSQPPVGSLVAREVYRRYRETWFLEEVFDDLLTWNRWWVEARVYDGNLLCWGSNPFDDPWERPGNNDWLGAAYESGLDNSPMYDNVPFDPDLHLMMLADVGLMGLYVMDCEALAEIADVLERGKEAMELRERARRFRDGLNRLWDPGWGAYVNHTLEPFAGSRRFSPTNFYPLLAGAPTEGQALRMLEMFYQPAYFGGEWIMPSIARSDPAYPEQDYWRGRIWGPMNFLVYLGLRKYGLEHAQQELAAKSAQLLLKEWTERGHVHENYNAETGEGCDVTQGSDPYYHWGGLLGLPALIEAGYLAGWEEPL